MWSSSRSVGLDVPQDTVACCTSCARTGVDVPRTVLTRGGMRRTPCPACWRNGSVQWRDTLKRDSASRASDPHLLRWAPPLQKKRCGGCEPGHRARGSSWASSATPAPGKSTLIQHLNGLLKPTVGRDSARRAGHLGGAKQDPGLSASRWAWCSSIPEYQLFEETVYKDIAFGPTNMGLSRERRSTSGSGRPPGLVGLPDDQLDKFAL